MTRITKIQLAEQLKSNCQKYLDTLELSESATEICTKIISRDLLAKNGRRVIYTVAAIKKSIAGLETSSKKYQKKVSISAATENTTTLYNIEKKSKIKLIPINIIKPLPENEITLELVQEQEVNPKNFTLEELYAMPTEKFGTEQMMKYVESIKHIKTKNVQNTEISQEITTTTNLGIQPAKRKDIIMGHSNNDQPITEWYGYKHMSDICFSLDDAYTQSGSNYVFGIDKNSEAKKVYAIVSLENRYKFISQRKNKTHIYEFFKNNCVFACDLDNVPITSENLSDAVDLFQNTFAKVFQEVFAFKPTEIKTHLLSASDETKISFHIIIDVYHNDELCGFRNFRDQKPFWAKFQENFPYDIDTQIYRKRSSLRCLYSTKFGQNRPFVFMSKSNPCDSFVNKNIQKILVDSVDDSLAVKQEKITEIPELYAENSDLWKRVENILNNADPNDFGPYMKWLKLNQYLKYFFGDNGLILSSKFFSRVWNDEFNISKNIEQYQNIKNKYVITIAALEEICNYVPVDQIKSIGERLNKNIIYNIYSAACIISSILGKNMSQLDEVFKTLTEAEICENQKKQKDHLFEETNPVYEKIKALYEKPYGPMSFTPEDLNKFLGKRVVFDEEFNSNRVIDYWPYLQQHNTVLLRSGTGTGKTYAFFKLVKEQKEINPKFKALYITYRVTMGQDIVSFPTQDENIDEFGHLSVGTYRDLNVNIDNLDIYCVQAESLWRLRDLSVFNFVMFDECEHFTKQLNHIKKIQTAEITGKIIKYIIRNIPNLWCSANLDTRTIQIVGGYMRKNKKPFCIENKFLDKEHFNIHIIPEYFSKLSELVSQDKKLIIPTNSKSTAEILYQKILECNPKAKICLMTKDTTDLNNSVMENVNREWLKYDHVIYTPVIECGVSFTKSHFDHIFAIFEKGSNCHLSQYNSMFRCRFPKSTDIFLAMTNKTSSFKFYAHTKRQLKISAMYNTIAPEYERLYGNLINTIEIVDGVQKRVVKSSGHLMDVLIGNIEFERYSQSNMMNLLLSELQRAGAKIILPTKINIEKIVKEDRVKYNKLISTRKEYDAVQILNNKRSSEFSYALSTGLSPERITKLVGLYQSPKNFNEAYVNYTFLQKLNSNKYEDEHKKNINKNNVIFTMYEFLKEIEYDFTNDYIVDDGSSDSNSDTIVKNSEKVENGVSILLYTLARFANRFNLENKSRPFKKDYVSKPADKQLWYLKKYLGGKLKKFCLYIDKDLDGLHIKTMNYRKSDDEKFNLPVIRNGIFMDEEKAKLISETIEPLEQVQEPLEQEEYKHETIMFDIQNSIPIKCN